MSNSFTRHPVGNFFLIKGLQIRLIKKIVYAAIISTLVGLGSLLLVYYIKYDNTAFYSYSFDAISATIGDRFNIISILYPSLIISAIVNIFIAAAIGLYASRKYAVPIFKLEQWATLLQEGHLGANLIFREKEEMKELSSKCNLLSTDLKEKFIEIDTALTNLKSLDICKDNSDIKKIQEVLNGLSLEGASFTVNTSIITAEEIKKATVSNG